MKQWKLSWNTFRSKPASLPVVNKRRYCKGNTAYYGEALRYLRYFLPQADTSPIYCAATLFSAPPAHKAQKVFSEEKKLLPLHRFFKKSIRGVAQSG